MYSKLFIIAYFFHTIIFQSCERTKIPFSKINTSTKYNFGDTLLIPNNYNFNIEVNGWPIKLGYEKLIDSNFYIIGENILNFSFDIEGKMKQTKRKIIVYPRNLPKKLSFDIIKSHNHNTDIYTEGLEEYKGQIYETGGKYKKSKLVKYSINNSETRKEYNYTDDIFAEGITILNDTIYGLSYREHKIFRFNSENLELIDIKNTPIDFEGWGLTNNGNSLIMSDGSNNIYYLNPSNYYITKILQVYNNKGKEVFLNELEYVDCFIYANVFTKNKIIILDSNSGAVLYSLDLSNIADMHNTQGVLNGIAKLDNGNFLITGKNWDKMYEIEIDKFD